VSAAAVAPSTRPRGHESSRGVGRDAGVKADYPLERGHDLAIAAEALDYVTGDRPQLVTAESRVPGLRAADRRVRSL
jgi:hypothetical protein